MMSRIDSWHWTISTGHHFQNGHHNTTQIQHCLISTTFHMWVDYDVLNWFPTSTCWICVILWWPFWKWWPVEIVQCQESIRDIIIYLHMKFRWNRTMLNLCGIVGAILKMATSRNFRCQESNRDIIIYPHIKFWWYRTMLNFYPPFFMPDYDVPNWFLTSKISTGCHFQNGHHNTTQIQHC
jgi:hypothetical protein